ncbi:hypothetical protein Y1Q_0013916 [Alligator mississippiensis]|uniref:Uncharacterized protein n=1 Tax=Alligator mississippiensis TaxID=8496 RepID=A0A151MVV9_ALLMI|nr:hypothetical protein Y1Q_0013916 [Alligator mississippiensis]
MLSVSPNLSTILPSSVPTLTYFLPSSPISGYVKRCRDTSANRKQVTTTVILNTESHIILSRRERRLTGHTCGLLAHVCPLQRT